MRPSLFTLIVYAHESPRAQYLVGMAQRVMERFPARLITIAIGDVGSGWNKEEKVLEIDGGGILCERIAFRASPEEAERLPSMIIPRLLPDLPIYLLYGADPIERLVMIDDIVTLSDRVIFDSESAHELSPFVEQALGYHREGRRDIADLNWARTEGWRHLLGEIFSSQEDILQVEAIDHIEVQYNAKESCTLNHTRLQAFYLLSWLRNQLGWQPCDVDSDAEGLSIFYSEGKRGRLIAQFRPEEPPGRIHRVAITTQTGWSYALVREAGVCEQIMFYRSAPESCYLPHHILLQQEENHTLLKEIRHQGTDVHYLQLLHSLRQIDEIIRRKDGISPLLE
ncbi:MAG: glucose-6-phosphate dehydrogenase assembly protein OpcA [Chlamydiota bacterium]|nr:glucose-6-phosphate dehydrogenase assembly protein OpcA [Chlamydiota bacterium]